MTRKRFIKLLMSRGYSRNEASNIAADTRSCGMGYSNAYKAEQVALAARIKLKEIDITAVCDAIRNIVDMATKVACAISKAVGAFAETYRAEMEVINENN